jgi:hypothetical protein
MAPPITVDIMAFLLGRLGPSQRFAGRFARKNIRLVAAQQGGMAASQPPA